MGDRDAALASAPFSDNWAYIKTELNWLDRLLAMAVSRQRREQNALAPMSRSTKDQISQHWWKGLVTIDQPPNYDEGRPPRPASASPNRNTPIGGNPDLDAPGQSRGNHRSSDGSPPDQSPIGYQQQITARIQASTAQGILLSLPALQDLLQLSLFEKQVLLMGLAPEVNRRYSNIYAFLQDNETGLPQLDLALKLLCRTDNDWHMGRSRLVTSPLVQSGLIRWVAPADRPQLRQGIQLAPALVNLLLSGVTTEAQLQDLLQGHLGSPWAAPDFGPALAPDKAVLGAAKPIVPGQSLHPASDRSPYFAPTYVAPIQALPNSETPSVGWAALILPADLKRELQHLAYRLNPDPNHPGTIGLFWGASGTGKTLAARAIASHSRAPILALDLQHYEPRQLPELLDRLQHQSPCLLLLRSARLLWRNSPVSDARLHRFWSHRRDRPCLTLLSDSTCGPCLIPQRWQERCDRRLHFPLPDETHRRRLWQRLLAQAGPVQRGFPWSHVARWDLSGGQIDRLARDAARYAAESQTEITLWAVKQAKAMSHNLTDSDC